MNHFSLGFVAELRSGLRSGRLPDLLPAILCRPRQQRTVLEALAEVGPVGMTPNSLEVSTELSEPRLNEALHDLVTAGLVCRQGKNTIEDDAIDDLGGGVNDPHDDFYLLAEFQMFAEHASRRA